MTVPARRGGRPQWMSHFGDEGFGDIFSDRLWGEWHRDFGKEWNPLHGYIRKRR